MPGKKLVLLFVAATALLGVIPASAAEATRESYKQDVEPICKTNAEANERILKGVKGKVRAGKLKAASKQVFAAARALTRTRAQLLQVPKPPADAARLTKWLAYVKTEVELFELLGRRLAKGEVRRTSPVVSRLYRTAIKANNLVVSFEFRYCRFEPSKYL